LPWLLSTVCSSAVLPRASTTEPAWSSQDTRARIVRHEEASHRQRPHREPRTVFELLSIDAAGEAVTISPDQVPFSSLVDALDETKQAPVAQPTQAPQAVASQAGASALNTVASAAPVAATAAPGVATIPAAQADAAAGGGWSILVYLLYFMLGTVVIGCIAFFAFAAMRAAKKMESRSSYSAKRRGFGSLSSQESGNASDGGGTRLASDNAASSGSYRDHPLERAGDPIVANEDERPSAGRSVVRAVLDAAPGQQEQSGSAARESYRDKRKGASETSEATPSRTDTSSPAPQHSSRARQSRTADVSTEAAHSEQRPRSSTATRRTARGAKPSTPVESAPVANPAAPSEQVGQIPKARSEIVAPTRDANNPDDAESNKDGAAARASSSARSHAAAREAAGKGGGSQASSTSGPPISTPQGSAAVDLPPQIMPERAMAYRARRSARESARENRPQSGA